MPTTRIPATKLSRMATTVLTRLPDSRCWPSQSQRRRDPCCEQGTLLWQELQKRNIPLSVVVYPWPAQVVHDTIDSKQVLMWRDWCTGKCESFISLFPAFLAVKNQCPQGQPGCWYLNQFVFGDEHYNAAGNAVV